MSTGQHHSAADVVEVLTRINAAWRDGAAARDGRLPRRARGHGVPQLRGAHGGQTAAHRQLRGVEWIAVWRTMQAIAEEPALPA